MYLHAHFDDNLQDDYRRLGVRHSECRLVIIRHAASQRANQLTSELNPQGQEGQLSAQLSEVATSTYRLLDPRRRENDLERAHVGRIHDAELLEATVGKRHDESAAPVFGLRVDSRHSLSASPRVSRHCQVSDPPIADGIVQTNTRPQPQGNAWSRVWLGLRGLASRVLTIR